MKMKKRSSGGGASWMDTYGDMVTLLLCFFVMLYSISTVEQSKWEALVRSFNPDAEFEAEKINPPPLTPEQRQLDIDKAIEALYQALSTYAAESPNSGIEVSKGDGYVFLSLNDAVFFAGDSYELLPDGAEVLSAVSDLLSQSVDYIDEVRIMGHTAQSRIGSPNNVMADRFLASNRATIATIYIQEHSALDPARLVSMGYGQHRPVDSNDTPEGRSHNRRVEIAITGLDISNQMGDSIEQYFSLREGDGSAEDAEQADTGDGQADAVDGQADAVDGQAPH